MGQYSVNVTRAVNGMDAVEKVKENPFDIIFITYEMNSLNGKETGRQIRHIKGEYYSNVPIVFVTKSDINDVFDDFMEAGFSDYLLKPVNEEALAGVLTRWLWQRFENDGQGNIIVETSFAGIQSELLELIGTIDSLYDNNKTDNLVHVFKAIETAATQMNLTDIYDLAMDIEEDIMLGKMEESMEKSKELKKLARIATNIN